MISKETDTKSREFANDIINTIRQPLVVLDSDLRVIFAGRSFYDVFKVTPEETVGRLVYDIGNKQWDIPKLRELLENIIPNRATFDNYEVDHEFPHIGKRKMLLNARRIPPPPEKIDTILLAIEDITARKLAENVSRMATVVRDSNDAIAIQDVEGNITAWNKGAELIFGYSEQEALQMKVWQLAPPDKLAEQKDFDRRLFAGEKVSSFETQRLTKDGRLLDMWLTATKLVDDAGKVVGIAATERDITARKKMEETLRKSEEKYRSIVENSSDQIFIVDKDYRYVSLNAALASTVGKPIQELLGKSLSECFQHDTAVRFMASIKKVFETGRGLSVEEEMTVENSNYYISTKLNPVRDAMGGVTAVTGIARDVTEGKRLEMILRASEEEFHTLAEAIPQMVWMTRPDGWNIYFNQQWEDYTGLTMEQSHGHGWLIAFHPDDKQRASDAWQNAIQKNGEYSIECRLRRADGVYHRWLIRGAPLYDKAGKVIKWFGTCTNIEDLKSAHDELQRKTLELDASLKESLQSREILENMLAENKAIREKVAQSELMFRNIFDQAGDGILIVDPESKAFYMSNKEIRRMLGYNQEEMKSLRVMDIHPEKDLPYVTEQFEKQAKKDFLLNREVPVKRKDGVVFYADINATNIMIAGKRYLMGLFHDTTERREIEDLKRMDKLKKDFISNMSHELRTPLNAVIGFSEILADQKFGPLNEVQKDYLNDVLESGKFLLSLINDILDLAKVESGKMKLELSDFSLKELLEGSLIFVKEKVLKHNIELILDIAKEVGTIRADERKVKQIVYNLLSNAVKFTLDGGKVGIKAEINGSEAKVTVWDTGIGISKEDQKKLFIAFVRLEAPLAKKYEGTGLGLSLAKDFVEMHNGKIWVESEGVRKGSSFTFTLPTGVA